MRILIFEEEQMPVQITIRNKIFDSRELLAYINALLRRQENQAETLRWIWKRYVEEKPFASLQEKLMSCALCFRLKAR